MYMATIKGYTEVRAFSESIEKATRLALAEKKRLCRDDLEKWTWENVEEYYGATVTEISEGTVISD